MPTPREETQQLHPPGWRGLGRAWARRPLALAALGLAGGLELGRLQGGGLPPAAAGAALALALGLAAAALARGWEGRLALGLCLAGLAGGLWRVQPLARALGEAPPPERCCLRLQAAVAADEGLRAGGRRVLLLGSARAQALGGGAWEDLQGGLRASLPAEAAAGLQPGDRLEAYGDLRAFPAPSNPGAFDQRRFALGRGLRARFLARQGWPLRRLQAAGDFSPARLLWRWRGFLRRGLEAGLQGRPLALARGVLLGDKAALQPEDLAEYARAGFADLLVVSGSHFALALGLALLLLRRCGLGRRPQAWLGLALGLAYALGTGFEVPVQRAFAAFAVWLLARALDLECEAANSLAFAALAVLLAQPGALWEPGFQLSFGCALGLLTLSPPLAAALPPAWPGRLRAGLAACLAAQLALLPLLALHFHQLCWPGLLSAPLGLLAAAGALSLGLPLALLGGRLPGAAGLLGPPLEALLGALDAAAERLAGLPGSAFSAGSPGAWLPALFALWSLAFLALAWPRRRPALLLAAALLPLALLWGGLPQRQRHPGLTKAWLFDVGQGDSLLLEFGDGRHLLVDGGPPGAGAWVLAPALRALGVQRLDWVLASHADADHSGGLAWVLEQFDCGTLLWNGLPSPEACWAAARAAALERGVPLRALAADQAPWPGQGPWAVLNPPAAGGMEGGNAASVVLNVEGWLLLAGDLPRSGERRLLRAGLRPAPVLKVSHHGSASASSPAWVGALAPREALLSCGSRNPFGHPSAAALAALAGLRLWRTDLQGCLALERGAAGELRFRPWREASAAALAAPRPRRPSPWRALEGLRPGAWAELGLACPPPRERP